MLQGAEDNTASVRARINRKEKEERHLSQDFKRATRATATSDAKAQLSHSRRMNNGSLEMLYTITVCVIRKDSSALEAHGKKNTLDDDFK